MMKARRKALGMTQAALAKLLSTSQAHLSRVESGHDVPSIEMADAIAHSLDYETLLVPRKDADRVRSLLDASGLQSDSWMDTSW